SFSFEGTQIRPSGAMAGVHSDAAGTVHAAVTSVAVMRATVGAANVGLGVGVRVGLDDADGATTESEAAGDEPGPVWRWPTNGPRTPAPIATTATRAPPANTRIRVL